MNSIRKPSTLIVFYISILLLLLLCVSTTPLLIRDGIRLTNRFIIEEDVVETGMILALFGVSFLILMQLMRRLHAYRAAVDRAVEEKAGLAERLSDAFRYIGKVNVEIQEIESALCEVAFYPQTKKEYRRLLDKLASKALTIAATPWLVVRMIDRHSGHTINEHTIRLSGGACPSKTLGNREILDGTRLNGLQTIGPHRQNSDLLTVIILPEPRLSREKTILLTALLNQIEMLFILHHTGCIRPKQICNQVQEREIAHDSNN